MITVEHLSKRFNRTRALQDVSLELPAGEILAVVGPSGCGKTTLLRLISGLETPDEGRILIDGAEVSTTRSLLAPYLRGVSLIFQDLALWPHMRAQEHLEFALDGNRNTKGAVREKLARILHDVGLEHHARRFPHELSGGEKQRLALARALAGEPKYLLMDEPFSNLDAIVKKSMHRLVSQLKTGYGLGIIYVTHQGSDALAVADRVVILNMGRIHHAGPAAEVKQNPADEFIRNLLEL